MAITRDEEVARRALGVPLNDGSGRVVRNGVIVSAQDRANSRRTLAVNDGYASRAGGSAPITDPTYTLDQEFKGPANGFVARPGDTDVSNYVGSRYDPDFAANNPGRTRSLAGIAPTAPSGAGVFNGTMSGTPRTMAEQALAIDQQADPMQLYQARQLLLANNGLGGRSYTPEQIAKAKPFEIMAEAALLPQRRAEFDRTEAVKAINDLPMKSAAIDKQLGDVQARMLAIENRVPFNTDANVEVEAKKLAALEKRAVTESDRTKARETLTARDGQANVLNVDLLKALGNQYDELTRQKIAVDKNTATISAKYGVVPGMAASPTAAGKPPSTDLLSDLDATVGAKPAATPAAALPALPALPSPGQQILMQNAEIERNRRRLTDPTGSGPSAWSDSAPGTSRLSPLPQGAAGWQNADGGYTLMLPGAEPARFANEAEAFASLQQQQQQAANSAWSNQAEGRPSPGSQWPAPSPAMPAPSAGYVAPALSSVLAPTRPSESAVMAALLSGGGSSMPNGGELASSPARTLANPVNAANVAWREQAEGRPSPGSQMLAAEPSLMNLGGEFAPSFDRVFTPLEKLAMALPAVEFRQPAARTLAPVASPVVAAPPLTPEQMIAEAAQGGITPRALTPQEMVLLAAEGGITPATPSAPPTAMPAIPSPVQPAAAPEVVGRRRRFLTQANTPAADTAGMERMAAEQRAANLQALAQQWQAVLPTQESFYNLFKPVNQPAQPPRFRRQLQP